MRTQTRKYIFNSPVSMNDVQKCACVKNNLNPHDISALCSIDTLAVGTSIVELLYRGTKFTLFTTSNLFR